MPTVRFALSLEAWDLSRNMTDHLASHSFAMIVFPDGKREPVIPLNVQFRGPLGTVSIGTASFY